MKKRKSKRVLVASYACGDNRKVAIRMRQQIRLIHKRAIVFMLALLGPIAKLLDPAKAAVVLDDMVTTVRHGATVVTVAAHEGCLVDPMTREGAIIAFGHAIRVIEDYFLQFAPEAIPEEGLVVECYWQANTKHKSWLAELVLKVRIERPVVEWDPKIPEL